MSGVIRAMATVTMATTTPSTATTTRSRPRRRRIWFSSGVSLVLGLGLLALAVPRTLAAFSALDAAPALYDANREREPKSDELARGIEGLKKSVAWVPSQKRFIDLAFLELVLALDMPAESPERSEALKDAEAHSVAGLSLNPAS